MKKTGRLLEAMFYTRSLVFAIEEPVPATCIGNFISELGLSKNHPTMLTVCV